MRFFAAVFVLNLVGRSSSGSAVRLAMAPPCTRVSSPEDSRVSRSRRIVSVTTSAAVRRVRPRSPGPSPVKRVTVQLSAFLGIHVVAQLKLPFGLTPAWRVSITKTKHTNAMQYHCCYVVFGEWSRRAPGEAGGRVAARIADVRSWGTWQTHERGKRWTGTRPPRAWRTPSARSSRSSPHRRLVGDGRVVGRLERGRTHEHLG